MQRNNAFFNPVDLEAGLYTMKILGISPRIGSSKIDLCMKILTFPLTKQNIDYSDRIVFITIDSKNKDFREFIRVFSWRKRTMKIEHTRGIYVDVVVSPTVFNGEIFNEFTQFSYSDDINYSEYDRTDKEQ